MTKSEHGRFGVDAGMEKYHTNPYRGTTRALPSRRSLCSISRMKRLLLAAAILLVASAGAFAQDNPTGDPIVQRIYEEGMRRSQAATLGQVLMDSIGPRLTGSPANRAANDWLLRTYATWGVPAKNEQYGTWRDWTRGPSSLKLVTPRSRVLEATMHAWSAPTPSGGV